MITHFNQHDHTFQSAWTHISISMNTHFNQHDHTFQSTWSHISWSHISINMNTHFMITHFNQHEHTFHDHTFQSTWTHISINMITHFNQHDHTFHDHTFQSTWTHISINTFQTVNGLHQPIKYMYCQVGTWVRQIAWPACCQRWLKCLCLILLKALGLPSTKYSTCACLQITCTSKILWCDFAFNGLILHSNISTTVHAMTKSFVLFCSAQDDESTDMNCLVFWVHCKNGKILMKCQVYNKGIFFTNLG